MCDANLAIISAGSLFKPSLKFVPQADMTVKTEADADKVAAMLASAGFNDSVVIDAKTGSVSTGNTSTWKRPKPWEHIMEQEGVDVNTIPTAENYTHSIRDLQKVARCVIVVCLLISCR